MRKIVYMMMLWFPVVLNGQVTDYSNEASWAALPGRKDAADWTPKGLTDEQENARADVFYIHPTTKLTGWGGNAGVADKSLNKSTDETAIKVQASVFNGSCKVYAPRYQQATLHNFFKRESEEAKGAFDKAYKDVKAAFDYYLKHYNKGRPIVIAGHSQGSMHAVRLLKEYFDGKPLQKQLVAAYVIGWPVKKSEFKSLVPSDTAIQVGALISYNTYGMDADPAYVDYRGSLCVNPLNWKTGQEFVSSASHRGGINKGFSGVRPKLTGCKCGNGMLHIQKPESGGYTPMAGKNYHIYDYQLFYQDIRDNVAQRIAAYFEQ